jgi:hypothetical protein
MGAAMAKTTAATKQAPETLTGYFRRILRENPKLLKGRSNDELLARWKEDHPGQDITNSVKAGLQNAKSALRSKRRRRKATPVEGQPAQETPKPARAASDSRNAHKLEALEEQIDDCLSHAKHLDRQGLAEVIRLLHRARNEVVWKMGQ